jgi:hypothetical protein
MLSQPERADPGVWPTLLNRTTKTGKRLASNAQAVDVLNNLPIIDFRRNQAAACDVVSGSAGELIRLFNERIIVFKESQNILYSTAHIVAVMTTGYPTGYVVKHCIDEF